MSLIQKAVALADPIGVKRLLEKHSVWAFTLRIKKLLTDFLIVLEYIPKIVLLT
jgi:hypothetical protein